MEPLHICNREAFINSSDKEIFPPAAAKCLGVVKKGQDGLLWLGSLVSVTDRLRDVRLMLD